MSQTYIAVIGASEATETEANLARAVGELLAEAGAVLISGGRGGVMSASCQGARDNGGVTVGILPGDQRADGNAFLSIALATGLGELRNGVIVAASDACIAIGGGWGTLSEIALAMRAGKPVIALNTWDLTLPSSVERPLLIADSPAHAVRLALASAGPDSAAR